ncbi:MAG: hypothetical protein NC416_12590 [Eubacterium sp.]|nr:hypothetical protein [Eubacterium sp.]
MADTIKNFLDKVSGREKEERKKKIGILKEVVGRNKIKNSSEYTIDDVVASSKAWNVKHDLYI